MGSSDDWLCWRSEHCYHHSSKIPDWSLRGRLLPRCVLQPEIDTVELVYPSIVYFITIWYRWNERAVRIALVIAFCNLAGAFGGAIAYGVGHINGTGGLEGLRWLLIIEGIIILLSAFLLWFFLPDYPARAKWLTAPEKKFAEYHLAERGGGYNQEHATRKEILDSCFSPRILLHYIAYIADVVPQGSFTFFTPTIVTSLGYKSIHAQLLTIPPWVVSFFSLSRSPTLQTGFTLAAGQSPSSRSSTVRAGSPPAFSE